MSHPRIKTIEELLPIVEEARKAGRRIVTTNGCFDIVHPGHVRNLEWARAQGDLLLVGVNTDRSVAQNKGPKRPIISELDRAEVIAGLKPVDYVFLFDDENPIPWVKKIRPDVHVKGAGSNLATGFGVERSAVEEGGGEMRLAPLFEGRSTTNIIDEVLKRHT